MSKILIVDCDRCTYCGLCIMVCSFKHEGEFNPSKARLTVDRAIPEGMMVPNVCWQCDSPAPCESACAMNAIRRIEDTGALVIDYERCSDCGVCSISCPYDNIRISSDTGQKIKCDLCGGDPECVKYCAYAALTFVEATEENMKRKKGLKEEISNLLAV